MNVFSIKTFFIFSLLFMSQEIMTIRALRPIPLNQIPVEQRTFYVNFFNTGNASQANLSSLDLRYAIASLRDRKGLSFRFSFAYADLSHVNFSQSNLTRAQFLRADCSRACFLNTKLDGANFCEADLSKAVLIGASLTNANLKNADLTGANFTNANLSGADLTGAITQGANFNNANVRGAIGLR